MDPQGGSVGVQQYGAMQIPAEIQTYLEDIIMQAQIPVYDDATKQEVVHDLFARLDKYLAIKIAEHLTDEQTQEFVKMNEEGKPQEEIDAFIGAHIPDASKLFEQAFIDFRDFYLTAQSNFADVANAGNPR